MSILGSIVSAIFHHAGVATSAQAAPAAPGASGSATGAAMPPKQPANSVDVDAALTKLAAQSK